MQYLQQVLREAEWGVTAAVHGDERIIAVWPGLKEEAYGVGFDVGSTTIAGHLIELRTGKVLASAGLMNPQIRFGEDLMSRVSYVMMNPGGDQEMTLAVREAITAMIGQLAAEALIDPNDILDLTFVGNPVMHHLLLGIDPTELGGAPFALATDEPIFLWASELSIHVTSPSARAYMLPCIAGHVGADAAGVILSETPHLNDEMTLIVDVGTNAEIILGNKHRCWPLPRQPDRLLKVLRSPAGSGRLPAPSSACASTPKPWSPASRSSARTSGPMRRPPKSKRSMTWSSTVRRGKVQAPPAFAGPASSRRLPRCISPASSVRMA